MTTSPVKQAQKPLSSGVINVLVGLAIVVVLAVLALYFKILVYDIKDIGTGTLNMPEQIADACFSGNLDTRVAVVGAGTIYGETAQQIASIVKQTQNALIGIVAFLLAFYFTIHFHHPCTRITCTGSSLSCPSPDTILSVFNGRNIYEELE